MKIVHVLLVLLLSGCAFKNVNVEPPAAYAGPQITGGEGRELVVAVPFADQRTSPGRCGMQKNGYNMDTADAICRVAPATRLAELLADGLRKAGFAVRSQATGAKPSALQIQGNLLQFFVEPVIGFAMGDMETDIKIRLVARSSTGLLAERDFFVKGTQSAFVGSESNFQKSVDDASMRVIQQMVAAIVTLLNRYPQLGGFPAAPTYPRA